MLIPLLLLLHFFSVVDDYDTSDYDLDSELEEDNSFDDTFPY